MIYDEKTTLKNGAFVFFSLSFSIIWIVIETNVLEHAWMMVLLFYTYTQYSFEPNSVMGEIIKFVLRLQRHLCFRIGEYSFTTRLCSM